MKDDIGRVPSGHVADQVRPGLGVQAHGALVAELHDHEVGHGLALHVEVRRGGAVGAARPHGDVPGRRWRPGGGRRDHRVVGDRATVTCRVTVAPASGLPPVYPIPARVSSSRSGCTGVEPVAGPASGSSTWTTYTPGSVRPATRLRAVPLNSTVEPSAVIPASAVATAPIGMSGGSAPSGAQSTNAVTPSRHKATRGPLVSAPASVTAPGSDGRNATGVADGEPIGGTVVHQRRGASDGVQPVGVETGADARHDAGGVAHVDNESTVGGHVDRPVDDEIEDVVGARVEVVRPRRLLSNRVGGARVRSGSWKTWWMQGSRIRTGS